MSWLVGRCPTLLFLFSICNQYVVLTNHYITRCPSLRAIRFHGNKEERENLSEEYFTNEAAAHDGRRPDKQIVNEKGELEDDNSDNPRAWDVCVTTYEVANTEKKALGRFAWKYLVIDEAHRLKNEASMFSTVSFTFLILSIFIVK
jgi:SWI/SNF-related matrix-associated actin-dependent regulator of chromatin subfamily A member 5